MALLTIDVTILQGPGRCLRSFKRKKILTNLKKNKLGYFRPLLKRVFFLFNNEIASTLDVSDM